jgi:prevent-host-death family protein
MRKTTKSVRSRPGNRRRLQDVKAHLSEVVRPAQQRGPQRIALHGRDAVVVVRADEFGCMRRPISGREIVVALATSPLANVNFERMTIAAQIRDVSL